MITSRLPYIIKLLQYVVNFYLPLLVFRFLVFGSGAFLPRPEDRLQPPFLDQLYTSNGGCSILIYHGHLLLTVVQWGRCGEEEEDRCAPEPADHALLDRHFTDDSSLARDHHFQVDPHYGNGSLSKPCWFLKVFFIMSSFILCDVLKSTY